MTENERILIVDGDAGVRKTLAEALRRRGYVVNQTGSGPQGTRMARDRSFHLALVGADRHATQAMDVARTLKESRPDMSVIVLDGGAPSPSTHPSPNDGISARIARPVDNDEVVNVVQQVLGTRHEALRMESASPGAGDAKQDAGEAAEGSIAEVVTYQDVTHRVRWASKAALQSAGLTPEEVLGRPCYEIWHGRQDPCPGCPVEEAATSGQPREGERTLPDGSTWSIQGIPIPGKHGGIEGVVAIARDVTGRKRTAEALRTSDESYRLLIETANEAIVVAQDGFLKLVNPKAAEITGYSQDELKALPFVELIHPEDRELVAQRHVQRLDGDPLPPEYEFRALRRDGQVRWVEIRTAVITWDGRPATLNLLSDITERKQAEEALRQSETRFRELTDLLPEIVYETDSYGRIVYANRAAFDALGYTPEDLQEGLSIADMIVPGERPRLAANLRTWGNGEELGVVEYTARRKDGTAFPILVHAGAVRDAEGRIIGARAVAMDITERKRLEEALRESEGKYRALVERANDGIAIIQDGETKYANRCLAQMAGYEVHEVVEKPFINYFHPYEAPVVLDRYRRRMAGEDVPSLYETVLRRKDGTDFHAEINAGTATYEGRPADLVFVRDITERKLAEQALRETEEKYRTLVDDMNDGYVVVRGSKVLFANRVAVHFGWPPGRLSGVSFLQYLTPESLDKSRRIYEQTRHGEPPPDIEEFEVMRTDGSTVLLEARIKEITYQGEKAYSLLLRDITERKQAEEEKACHARRLEALHSVAHTVSQSHDLPSLLDGVLARVLEAVEADAGGVYLMDTGAGKLSLRATAGLSQEFATGVAELAIDSNRIETAMKRGEIDFETTSLLGADEKAAIASAVQRDGLQAYVAVPFGARSAPLGVLVVASQCERQFGKSELEFVQATANELGIGVENVRLLERTRQLSVTDELTGLYNRRHFYASLENEIARTQRYGRSFALVLIDLDGFKEYNDRFGHVNGDAALNSMADTLKSSLRKSDTGFRYGGDEFAILLPATDAAKARKIVDRLRQRWLRAPRSDSLVLESPLGFSAGIAQYPADAETADGLAFLADTTLYHSKRQGGYRTTQASELAMVPHGVMGDAVLDHVYALAATVDARDHYTHGHSERVAAISEAIGRAMNLPMEELLNLHAAALLHDIGKVGVPDSILTKPGRLSVDERAVIERHAAVGARIVGHIRELAALVPVVRHHHEWYDGSGYPDGLKGDEIPLSARIVAIADAYDTMTTPRPYRTQVSEAEALQELRRCAGTQFDPVLVTAFQRVMEELPQTKAGVTG